MPSYPPTIFVQAGEASLLAAAKRLVDDEPALAVRSIAFYGDSPDAVDARSNPQPGFFLFTFDARGAARLARRPKHLDQLGLAVIAVVVPPTMDAAALALRGGAAEVLFEPLTSVKLRAALVRNAGVAQKKHGERRLRVGARARFAQLTLRERQVCMHVVSGKLNKQVAAKLGISEKTVKFHRAQMMRKLHVDGVAGLVRLVDRLAGDHAGEIGTPLQLDKGGGDGPSTPRSSWPPPDSL